MDFNKWLEKNTKELILITRRITQNHQDTDELFQEVILQLLNKPEKINSLNDKEKKYFFIKVIKNNWNSSTSPYRYHLTKHKNRHTPYQDFHGKNLVEEVYEENTPDMDWVYDTINQFDWFERDLFKLWVELGTYTQVSNETTIPLNSVGKYIKKTIKKLNNEWDNKK